MAPEDTTANAAVAGEGVAEPIEAKGKGKAASDEPAIEDDAMEEDDSSSDEEGEGEGEQADDNDNGEDDGMDEIDLKNIVDGGRRTRGRVIDFAKAAEENPAQDDDDEDDDEDFQAPDNDEKMDTN